MRCARRRVAAESDADAGVRGLYRHQLPLLGLDQKASYRGRSGAGLPVRDPGAGGGRCDWYLAILLDRRFLAFFLLILALDILYNDIPYHDNTNYFIYRSIQKKMKGEYIDFILCNLAMLFI